MSASSLASGWLSRTERKARWYTSRACSARAAASPASCDAASAACRAALQLTRAHTHAQSFQSPLAPPSAAD